MLANLGRRASELTLLGRSIGCKERYGDFAVDQQVTRQ